MARFAAQSGPAVAADVTALPFRAGSFDLAVGAYVVNHLDRPSAGLAELRRVSRPGGSVLASVFSATRASSKAAVDEVADDFGFVRPEWYDELQRRVTAIGSTEAMERALIDAGFSSFTVTEQAVDVGPARAGPGGALPDGHAAPEGVPRRPGPGPPRGVPRRGDSGGAAHWRETFAPVVIEAVAIA